MFQDLPARDIIIFKHNSNLVQHGLEDSPFDYEIATKPESVTKSTTNISINFKKLGDRFSPSHVHIFLTIQPHSLSMTISSIGGDSVAYVKRSGNI